MWTAAIIGILLGQIIVNKRDIEQVKEVKTKEVKEQKTKAKK